MAISVTTIFTLTIASLNIVISNPYKHYNTSILSKRPNTLISPVLHVNALINTPAYIQLFNLRSIRQKSTFSEIPVESKNTGEVCLEKCINDSPKRQLFSALSTRLQVLLVYQLDFELIF